MPLQCNLDRRGKVVRLLWGVLCLVAGVLCIVLWALGGGGWAAWGVSILLIVSGAMGIFEAKAGWCIVRAMGIKTRW